MTAVDLSFRTATPTDVDAAVPLIYSSGPVAFDYVFSVKGKGSGTDFIRFCFPFKGGEIDYQKHMVAIIDGQVVGIGAGFGGHLVNQNTISIAKDMLRFYGPVKTLGVIRRGLQFEKMVKPPTKKEFSIVHIGVAPAFRGRGIGRKIMEQLISQAGTKGYPTVVLDVAEKNVAAKSLYEDLGFRIANYYPSDLKRKDWDEAVPGHFRMRLQLDRE